MDKPQNARSPRCPRRRDDPALATLGWNPCASRSPPRRRSCASFVTRCASTTGAGASSSRWTASTEPARPCSRTLSLRSSRRTDRRCSAHRSTTSIARASERQARGRRSPEGYYLDSFDYATFRRVLIDPFREGVQTGATTGFQLAAFDLARDAPVESAWTTAPRDAVLIVDGVFLHRPELRGLWDWSVWLDVPIDVAAQRTGAARRIRPESRRALARPLPRRPGAVPQGRRSAERGIRDRRQHRPRPSPPRVPGLLLMVAPGVLLVDKPGGMTSHDVVARARRSLGTRKIGHAGTLDPMATGLLILGVEAATRLLTFIVGLDKTYEATIRLGATTDTDDAEGGTTRTTDAGGREPRGDRRRPSRRSPDEISQVPSTRLGDQGRRPPRLRPGPRGRGGRARRAPGDGLAVRGDARAADAADGHRPRCRGRLLQRHLHPRPRTRPRRRSSASAGT